MADQASENSKNKGIFSYTSGDYWEGSGFPYWVLMILTALPTGFFGLDHLFFHSPMTAVQKGLTNIFTFGLWYWYDVVQVFTDREYVQKYGLSRPIIGPTGLAHKYFRNVVPPEKQEEPDLPAAEKGQYSNIYLMLYLGLLLIPFGISNFLVGNTSGGVIKFIFTIIFFGLLIPIVFLSSLVELYGVISDPQRLYEKGVNLSIPFSWFVGSEHIAPSLMKPSAVAAAEAAASKPQGSFFTRLIQPIFDLLGLSTITQMVGAAKCAAEPVIEQGKKTVEAATTAATGVAALAGTVPAVATKVAGKLEAFTDPEKLKAAATGAALASVPQAGGGLLDSGDLDTWFFMAIGVFVFSAFSLSAVRWLRNIQTQKNDKPPESKPVQRDDTPPQPDAL
jgi:hypothetical protein